MRFKSFLVSMLVLAGMALAQTKGTPDITPAEQAKINSAAGQLPFFFPPGFYQTSDPLRQREEYVRWLNSTWHCNQGDPNGMGATIPGSDSITVLTDVVSTDSVTENPAKMKMVFDHYIRMPDGRIRYTDLCHTEFITDAQFKVVVDGLRKQAVDGAQRDHDFYVIIYEKSISARAAKLSIPRDELVK